MSLDQVLAAQTTLAAATEALAASKKGMEFYTRQYAKRAALLATAQKAFDEAKAAFSAPPAKKIA